MKTLIAFMFAALIACAAPTLAGDAEAAAGKVKGSKSNSSERVGEGNVQEATTVKSGKSNSSDRVGAATGGAQKGTTVKSSKSNSSE